MSTDNLTPCCPDTIKSSLTETLLLGVDEVLTAVEQGADARTVELMVWKAVLPVARELVAQGFGLLALRSTNEDLRTRDLKREDVRLRTDADYWLAVNTSVGRSSSRSAPIAMSRRVTPR